MHGVQGEFGFSAGTEINTCNNHERPRAIVNRWGSGKKNKKKRRHHALLALQVWYGLLSMERMSDCRTCEGCARKPRVVDGFASNVYLHEGITLGCVVGKEENGPF